MEAIVAKEGIILTESQVADLERAKDEQSELGWFMLRDLKSKKNRFKNSLVK